MPLKSSFTREAFIDAAFRIVRTKGWDNLTARSLAKELSCSTMPIYSYLKSMKSLYEELRKKAVDLLTTYQTTPRTGQIFLDMGVGYISFAKQEKNLFRFLHQRKEGEERYHEIEKRIRESALKNLTQNMKVDPMLEGLDEQTLRDVLTKMWIFVHGLAFLVSNDAFGDDENDVLETIKETGKLLILGEKNSKEA
ncbi:MAG TPA: TetR/AcrR family transcriptional regulator [Thermodesulfobacteriota bacterium]|nr:TetR/AcrR family transcriptional regulator [Thermodesulfobacteriota bacterium]